MTKSDLEKVHADYLELFDHMEGLYSIESMAKYYETLEILRCLLAEAESEPADNRAKFEHVAKIFGFNEFTRHKFDEWMSPVELKFNGRYIDERLERAWREWQIRAALPENSKLPHIDTKKSH